MYAWSARVTGISGPDAGNAHIYGDIDQPLPLHIKFESRMPDIGFLKYGNSIVLYTC